MKILKSLIFISTLFISCTNNNTYSQKLNLTKEYTFDYHEKIAKPIDFSDYFGNLEYQLENYIIPITKEKYITDSISYKSESFKQEKQIIDGNLLLPYGNIKFDNKDLDISSDAYIEYSYIGFLKSLNRHIIRISLYEGQIILLLKDDAYSYEIIESEPIISPHKEKLLTFNDHEHLSSDLIIYEIRKDSLLFNKYLWSEDNIILNAFWNKENNIIIKLKSSNNETISYYEIKKDFIETNKKTDLKILLKNNLNTADRITDYLIFTKDENNSLIVNTEILDYISKNTTRESSEYLFALEEYHNKYVFNHSNWDDYDFVKIQAYIFNTTYPLLKKYWPENHKVWYGGNPFDLLGVRDTWQKNSFYNIPGLEKNLLDYTMNFWPED